MTATKYFISDPHFGHKNILRFERTQFSTIEEHDTFIVDMINTTVKETDELYILGDIGNLDTARRIKCRTILIMGNHDGQTVSKYKSFFAEVHTTPVYLKENIVLSHIPIPVTNEILNVHGHLHGSRLASLNHLNLSAHMINYKPVSEDQLYLLASKLPKQSIRFLEEWYADLYVFDRPEERTDVVTDHHGRILLKESRKLRDEQIKDPSGYKMDVFKKAE